MTDQITDSTDWLSTPLSALAAVENALRCQVCKDFYKTPMITTCSHTFCSICIRRALSNDGKCPLCRSPEQELKLRSNLSLAETLDAFVKARPATLELARNGAAGSAGKRKAEEASHEATNAPDGKRLRTSARLKKSRVEVEETDVAQDDDPIPISDDDDDYTPYDGLVPCPVCRARMKEWQVFKHLESCPGPTPRKPKITTNQASDSSTLAQLQRQPMKPMERLPALNYSILRDQALRKKLGELGIPAYGTRPQLEKRHKEWITMWNANCDAARPKKRAELLRDLDAWERTQMSTLRLGIQVKDKEFDGAAWSAKHDASFKDLIASARRSRPQATTKTEEAPKPASTGGPASTKPSRWEPAPSPTRHTVQDGDEVLEISEVDESDIDDPGYIQFLRTEAHLRAKERAARKRQKSGMSNPGDGQDTTQTTQGWIGSSTPVNSLVSSNPHLPATGPASIQSLVPGPNQPSCPGWRPIE